MLQFRELSLDPLTTLLCDADGNLFPSEEPAFDASAGVVSRLLAEVGVSTDLTGPELRAQAAGRNFRAFVTDLAAEHGVGLDEQKLETWVAEELGVVTAHLSTTLRPDERVREPLRMLSDRFVLSVVSSSALSRLGVCFEATGLDALFPDKLRFSAQDSLDVPTSKPDPAVYVEAGKQLGIAQSEGLAIEDAAPGVLSARAAGFEVLGNLVFVPPEERAQRVEDLRAAGAAAVIDDWAELVELLAGTPGRGELVSR